MARNAIIITLTTDTRQLARESRLLKPAQVNAYLSGRLPVWMDEEHHGDQVVVTPRLCHG